MTSAGDTVAWSALLTEATARLELAGLDSPSVDARRIVEEAAGAEPSELHLMLDDPATVRGVARLDSMLARRESGEPLQYVLGRWGFRYLDLMVDRRVLVPRPETEVVAGLAIEQVNACSADSADQVIVADLGTGSGAIGLSVASECNRTRVLLADISADALAVAGANLAAVGRAATRVSIHSGSWFEAIPDEFKGRIDVVVSNPPYIADDEQLPAVVSDWEPRDALMSGPAGTEALEHIVGSSLDWLSPTGTLVLEMAPWQTIPIAKVCSDTGFTCSIHPDLAGRDRAVVARLVP